MYVLRQMVGKRLEVQGSIIMALGFVDLEKAFDTVPREMVMATLRWMGVPEAEVRMVKGMYEKTTARGVVEEGASEEFEVKIGLRQGSVLSPLKINVEKTGEHIGHQREMDIELEGKKLTQGDSFVYLEGAVCGDGKTEREVRRRAQANTWRAVDGVTGGPAVLKKTQGQGHEHLCDTGMPVRNGNLGTDLITTKAASVRKQLGTKNSKSNEGRQEKNGGVKGRDRSAKELATERLVRSRLHWAGHVERMADDRLPKTAAKLREEGMRRRGRPRLRWEDCAKRYVRMAGEEEDWKKEDKRQRRVEKTIR